MSKFSRFLSPEKLALIFTGLAMIGVVFLAVALITGRPIFATIAQVFLAPLILGAIYIVIVVVPFLIYQNFKAKRDE